MCIPSRENYIRLETALREGGEDKVAALIND